MSILRNLPTVLVSVLALAGAPHAARADESVPPLTTLERKTPAWLTNASVYQLYPQSFSDSNGDGIGDLPGIIAKLDYIKTLGVGAIWLNPFFESPFTDAGYDVSDYKKVAPRYGTNADAQRLFAEAHRRGLRVILDLVAGHTSIDHPWFKASAAGADSEYAHWYIWTPAEAQENGLVNSPGLRPGKYLKNFFNTQAGLNYGYGKIDPTKPWQRPPSAPCCMAVREAMRDVMKFWLDQGCDGFRVDMAASLIKEDDGKALRALWSDYRTWLDRNYPEAVLIAEWGQPDQAIRAGFNVDFLIHFGNPAYQHLMAPQLGGKGPPKNESFFNPEGPGDIRKFLDPYLSLYSCTKNLGFISLPTGNHDFSRPRFLGREIPDLKVIYAMLLTMPGVPFVYYGDEIGMRNLKDWPDKEGAMWRGSCRSPMQWAPGEKAGFSTASPERFYLPLDPDAARPDVATQEKDPESLLNLTRRLLELRKAHPSLGNLGGFKPLYAESGKTPFVYLRSGGPDNFIVAVNPSREGQRCTLPELAGGEFILNAGAALDGASLTMPPISYVILKANSAPR